MPDISSSIIYLIPTVLAPGESQVIPAYVWDAVKQCRVFFVENERTTRRWLKSAWKEMDIDAYKWFTIHKAEAEVLQSFRSAIKAGEVIGIISEAGCPGIADPGQLLVHAAQEMGAQVRPLVGPSAVLLALMASGLNGQSFRFRGYLPVEPSQRQKALRHIEQEMLKENCTQLFIETPYRNNAMLKDIIASCKESTQLCIAADITSPAEYIVTRKIGEWKKKDLPELHKRPVLFLLGS